MGAEFFKCEKKLFSLDFIGCSLQYCNFAELPMKRGKFVNSTLKECHFTETNLTETEFTDSDLTKTQFHNCNLSKADFSKAMNYSIDPSTNKMAKAKFSLPEAAKLLCGFDIEII